MADGIEIKMQGFKELSIALKELPKEIQGKVLGSAVAAGARIIRDEARANAPELSGFTKKAIVVYRDKKSKQDRIIYNVGVTLKIRKVGDVLAGSRRQMQKIRAAGNKTKALTAFYWRFLEFGHGPPTHRKGRALKNPKGGSTPGKPFMQPAFEHRQYEAAERIKTALAEAIEKAAAKLGRK